MPPPPGGEGPHRQPGSSPRQQVTCQDKHISDPPHSYGRLAPSRPAIFNTGHRASASSSITPLPIPTLSMSAAAVPLPQTVPASPHPLDHPTHVHGLSYPTDFLDALPVLQTRPQPHQPIRALDAAQFSRVHLDYVTTHAPDGVLFPFLHGLEGDNRQQNGFFAASPQAHTVPRFRGLVWVACDDDVTMLPSPTSSPDPDTDDDIDDETSSTSSLESLDAMSMDVDVDVTPGSPMEYDPTLRDSIEANPASPSGKIDDKPLPPALDVQPHTTATILLSSARTRYPYQHPAVLTSSFRPRELLRPWTKEDGSVSCAFVEPRVPDGVSLRNFGIQAVSGSFFPSTQFPASYSFYFAAALHHAFPFVLSFVPSRCQPLSAFRWLRGKRLWNASRDSPCACAGGRDLRAPYLTLCVAGLAWLSLVELCSDRLRIPGLHSPLRVLCRRQGRLAAPVSWPWPSLAHHREGPRYGAAHGGSGCYHFQ